MGSPAGAGFGPAPPAHTRPRAPPSSRGSASPRAPRPRCALWALKGPSPAPAPRPIMPPKIIDRGLEAAAPGPVTPSRPPSIPRHNGDAAYD